MLWVHLLAGRGLRPTATGSSPGSPPSGPLAPPQPAVVPRDLYCVLECDRVHKARTVVSVTLIHRRYSTLKGKGNPWSWGSLLPSNERELCGYHIENFCSNFCY